ncbi:MAG: histidine phosphatase family protein [Actinomycetia bacterium]|nr:histidine phosphatase family protein [Actinomycetes bacterium]
MELILVRHGEVNISNISNSLKKILETKLLEKYEDTIKKLDNIGLSDSGKEQANLLGRWLQKNYKIDTLYSSKLRRAKETSKIVNEFLNLPIIFRDELREATFYLPDYLSGWSSPIQFGKDLKKKNFDMRTKIDTTLKEREIKIESLKVKKAINTQKYENFRKKIEKIIKEIISNNWEKTVLIITHGGAIGTMIRNIIGRHDMTIRMDFTGLSKFSWIKEYNRWQIDFINKTDHLSAPLSG